MLGRRSRRAVVIGLPSLALGLVLAGGWSAHLALSVRDHLEATRADLLRLRSADPRTAVASAAGTLADARRHAAQARRITDRPEWRLFTHAPVVGDGATTTRGLAEAVAQVTDVLADIERAGAPLIEVGAEPAAVGDLRPILAGLDAAAPVLDHAVTRLAAVRSLVAGTPARTGVAALDQARDTMLREVDRLRGWVRTGADAASLIPPMLGRDGPRRYFLAFQTNAEARGTGGLVGAFGILTADHGRLGIERLSANNGLALSSTSVTDFGPDFRSRYGRGATSMLSVSNLSPHFPYAAATWTGLWQRKTGRSLDGAIATDPAGLAHLLELIGPVRLPGGERVTAGNVVDLTERAAYVRYPDPAERKRFLIRIAAAVSEALVSSKAFAEPARVLPVLSGIVEERRIQIWSRRDAEERRLAATPLGGVLPERRGPFAGLVINNSGGTKLDYYLKRSLTYTLGPCRGDGLRASTVRIRLANDVPPGKLPTYVTDRLDSPGRSHPPGSNRLWVSLYAGIGARAIAARLDGRPVGFYAETERSHPVYSTVLEFAPRQVRTIEFDLLEPGSTVAPVVPVQPLVRSQQTVIRQEGQNCAP
ncbi:DUF4012 domain-containing protein [Sphaerimonospora cavernae]|uniref:DUF4012 domain-containing protein n=1 Tax=Sphaerimonospora cavernae TaxID=1740611 RepID=A0ABV6U4T2_9ACTN